MQRCKSCVSCRASYVVREVSKLHEDVTKRASVRTDELRHARHSIGQTSQPIAVHPEQLEPSQTANRIGQLLEPVVLEEQ